MWPVVERSGRYMRAAYIDLRLLMTGKRDRELPPLRLRFVGAGDFRGTGEHLLQLTITRAGLTPRSRILDVGCGPGRLALPLCRYLAHGEYDGFDVVASVIAWCKRHITSTHPNFRFAHVSLRNSDYSLLGGAASNFVFPYPDDQFDCVVAYSVFTHLAFEETANYLRQIHRVLVPGGRFVATFFLLNERSKAAERAVPGVRQFPYERGPIGLGSESNPALAVAIEESALAELLIETGFRKTMIEPGAWYGLQNAPTYQDLVSCEK